MRGRLLLCPTVTLPKFREPGLTANWPETVAVPVMVMVTKGLEASDTTEIEPGALPPALGAKTTPKVKLCPGLRAKRQCQTGDLVAAASNVCLSHIYDGTASVG